MRGDSDKDSAAMSKLELNSIITYVDSEEDEEDADYQGPEKMGIAQYLIVALCGLVSSFVVAMMVYAFAT